MTGAPPETLTGAFCDRIGHRHSPSQLAGQSSSRERASLILLLSAMIQVPTAEASATNSVRRSSDNMTVVPVTPGVTRAVLQVRYQGQICNNVLHFKQAGAGAAPPPAQLGERLATWWYLGIRSHVPLSCCLDQVICTDLSEAGAPGTITFPPVTPACGSSVNASPNNVTCVFSIRTALRGRSFRGRIYHIGIDESLVDDNRLLPALRDPLLAAYDDLTVFTGPVGQPDFLLGVLSTVADGSPRAAGLFTPATGVVTDGVVDSQRRRLPGRGR